MMMMMTTGLEGVQMLSLIEMIEYYQAPACVVSASARLTILQICAHHTVAE